MIILVCHCRATASLLSTPSFLFFPVIANWAINQTLTQKVVIRLHITMVQNRKKLRKKSHLFIHFPTSLGVSEVSERVNE